MAEELSAVLPEASVPVLFVEEEIRAGGFGMMLSDALRAISDFGSRPSCILALNDCFLTQTKVEPIYKTAGVDADAMVKVLEELR